MNRVLILGAGNIGSRHLQSLAESSIPLEIVAVDPSARALEMSRKRFEEVVKQKSIQKPAYFTNLDGAGTEFDVAIVATNADVRKKVVEELLHECKVKYLVLEKVAFQNSKDFEQTIKLLNVKGVKAWVNLPRRVVPFYQGVRKMIEPHEQVFCTVQGGDWGLACNAIHFIDLLCFLARETDYSLSCSGLDQALKESKRKGFVEFTGSLHCHFRNGSQLNLISKNSSNCPIMITILTESMMWIIEEDKGLARKSLRENKWKWEEIRFKWYSQSELTHKIVEGILKTGKCELPTIEESYLIHKPLLGSFIEYLEETTGKKYSACPIT